MENDETSRRIIEPLQNQMLAALSVLNQCINNCPHDEWNKSHNDSPFSQVLWHVLFYADLYLSTSISEFKSQVFHREHENIFRGYEELEWRKPEKTYTRDEIILYYDFCRNKIKEYFTRIHENDLYKKSNHKNMTMIEALIEITRHIQHHAAQLGLRVQQITGKELEWINK
ncbi:DinB family protein [Parasphaerochaeta coccoides]|uniref:DinB-like domain-containing protein n=1 Tax=Parasphaerochaeta coccoides (strain ATCC BAA-1237 / DSM 17374 / SPN1) TaxID=760011 RepID=F4GJW4_PARC1|nr:DinB family protein [Parasphaerochaeta coccoides]AEC01389.1 hypothetical protein Spico_0151 [Parasphaerochaeta coccoides DSM 17374]